MSRSHGTISNYEKGRCRCGPCTFVSSEARAERRRKQRDRERRALEQERRP